MARFCLFYKEFMGFDGVEIDDLFDVVLSEIGDLGLTSRKVRKYKGLEWFER